MPCAGNQREGLVRVVRLMLTHGRVVVTMRGDKTRSDAVSPQNGIDGARTRLMKN